MNEQAQKQEHPLEQIVDISPEDAFFWNREKFIGQRGYFTAHEFIKPDENGFQAGKFTFLSDGLPRVFHKIKVGLAPSEPGKYFQDNRQMAVDYIRHMEAFFTRMQEEGWSGSVCFSEETLDEDTWMEGLYDSDGDELLDPKKTMEYGEELINEEQDRLAGIYGYTFAGVRDGLYSLIRMVETNQIINEFGITSDELKKILG